MIGYDFETEPAQLVSITRKLIIIKEVIIVVCSIFVHTMNVNLQAEDEEH